MSFRSHSQWTLFRVWSKDLLELTEAHKESDYKLLSKLHLGDKIFQAVKVQGCNTKIEASDQFSLVEVNEIADIEVNEDKDLIVRGHEPRLADNWFVPEPELKLNVQFKADLSLCIKDKLKPRDLIVVCWGRTTYNSEEEVTQIETNVSPLSPVTVIIFRPQPIDNLEDSEDVDDYMRHFNKYSQLRCNVFTDKDRELVWICPKKYLADEANAIADRLNEERESEESETDHESDSSDTSDVNNNFVPEGGIHTRAYSWKNMPLFDDEEDDLDENSSESDEDADATYFNNIEVDMQSNELDAQSEIRENTNRRDDPDIVEILESGDEDVEERLSTSEVLRNISRALEIDPRDDVEANESDSLFLSASINNLNESSDNLFEGVSDMSSIELDSNVRLYIKSPTKGSSKAGSNLSDASSSSSSVNVSLTSFNSKEKVDTPEFFNAAVHKVNGDSKAKRRPTKIRSQM